MNQDYENLKVQEIRQNLGEFDYGSNSNMDNNQLEYRPMQILENHAKFEG